MKLPHFTPGDYATFQGRAIRFGLHRANTHAGSSVPFRDPWSYVRYWIRDNYDPTSRADALELAKQAERFYRIAAQAPSETSPLLWYYCFLNLAKAFLLKDPSTYSPANIEDARHGIADPTDNDTGYVKLSKQKVSVFGVWSADTPPKLQVFPALCVALGTPIAIPPGKKSVRLSIKHLLSHIVCIHRAFATAYAAPLRFCRTDVYSMETRQPSGKAGTLWHLLNIDPIDVQAAKTAFKSYERPGLIKAVSPIVDGVHSYEGNGTAFSNSNFVDKLAEQRATLRGIVHPLLLPQGYRYYLHSDSQVLRQQCSIYAVMFYLGTIVRYNPQRFASLVGNKYHWLIEEFMQVCPKQFVALMINEITDSELPYFDY